MKEIYIIRNKNLVSTDSTEAVMSKWQVMKPYLRMVWEAAKVPFAILVPGGLVIAYGPRIYRFARRKIRGF